MPDCDILQFGDYFCDVVITGLPEPPRLGADVFGQHMEIVPGGAYNMVTALHRLGVGVRWAARFGNDLFSRFVLEQAHSEGLDQSLFELYPGPLRSLSVSFSFAHDRGFISYTDPFPDQRIRAIMEAQPSRWVVNLPFDGSVESRALVEHAHCLGTRVYTDCQYVTTTLDEPGLPELLAQTDIFAPNWSEASQLTGELDPLAALERLAKGCPMVVLKCGAHGAYARRGDQIWHAPALPVEVIDTTGAGDSFNAGFLAALLQGLPIETCLRWGNYCGGMSTTQRGGTQAAPTLRQLERDLT